MNLNINNVFKRITRSKTERFVESLIKCDAEAFMGICKILNIQVGNGAKTKEEFDLRPFEEVWSDIVGKFDGLGKKQKKELLQIIEEAVTPDGKK